MTRTTEPSARRSKKRPTKAATTKIVLSGCSTGLVLGMIGVMALAESTAPAADVAVTMPAASAPTAGPAADVATTLPPKRIVTYVYRQVLVPDPAAANTGAAAVTTGARPTTRVPPATVPAPRPAQRTATRAVAPTTTTTQAS